jgi:hypothetical protein
MGFQNKLVRLADKHSEEQEISVPTCDQSSSFSHSFETRRYLAPLLFNVALEMTLQQAQCNLIGMIFNKNHIIIAYADDVVIPSKSKAHMIETLVKLKLKPKNLVL